ncbi:MAG: hypothetical protein JXC32_19205, partial [Anaerolineae bacterium]|nr:hypothetical protein [Anaerolineae bacterium]
MKSKVRRLWIITSTALVLAGVLVFRAGFKPCAWLDLALMHSGCLCTVSELDSAIASVAFSPDGSVIAASSQRGEVMLWRAADRSLLRTLEAQPATRTVAYTYDLAFSADGTRLALGQPDGAVQLWTMPDGQPARRLEADDGAILSLAFSPDGQTLASGTAGGAVQVWRIDDGVLANEIGGHGERVVSIAFSPDGTSLAAASLDGTVALWQVADGALLASAGSYPVATGVDFSPDGTLLVANRQLLRIPDLQPIRA